MENLKGKGKRELARDLLDLLIEAGLENLREQSEASAAKLAEARKWFDKIFPVVFATEYPGGLARDHHSVELIVTNVLSQEGFYFDSRKAFAIYNKCKKYPFDTPTDEEWEEIRKKIWEGYC